MAGLWLKAHQPFVLNVPLFCCSKEICDPNTNVTMCPLCDFQCPYWNLVEACTHAKASRIFDNGGTVFFAIFMALWGKIIFSLSPVISCSWLFWLLSCIYFFNLTIDFSLLIVRAECLHVARWSLCRYGIFIHLY